MCFKYMQKKSILVQKEIKHIRYMRKYCIFFRSMHLTMRKFQTYVKFFKSMSRLDKYLYVLFSVTKRLISIMRFKSNVQIGQSCSTDSIVGRTYISCSQVLVQSDFLNPRNLKEKCIIALQSQYHTCYFVKVNKYKKDFNSRNKPPSHASYPCHTYT